MIPQRNLVSLFDLQKSIRPVPWPVPAVVASLRPSAPLCGGADRPRRPAAAGWVLGTTVGPAGFVGKELGKSSVWII